MAKVKTNIDVSERLSVLEERVGNWIQSTETYRHQKDKCSQVLFDKIDTLQTMLTRLPCGERKGIYNSVKGQLAAIWVFVAGGIGVMLKHFIEGHK